MKLLRTIKEYAALPFIITYCWMNRDCPPRRSPQDAPVPKQTLKDAVADCERYIRSRISLEDMDNCEQLIELKIKGQHRHHPAMQLEYDALQIVLNNKVYELQMVELSEYAFVAEQNWRRHIVYN
jgi:hypothetical protein